MKIYLVGGAVRDKLLKIKFTDNDYCVTGSTIDDMKSKGFICVGKEFPVFIHPKTKEEYALARTERKSGHGYTGFICSFDPSVTIEEDLKRRDLTINAIAQDSDGNYIDPYNGKEDIKNKILRHVSDAFSEDPLRVLRLARFYAKLKHLGFSIAPETTELCKKIVSQGEINHLTPERIWIETEKALGTNNPECFFEFLLECGALHIIMPEIALLAKITENTLYHPEGDSFKHTMLTLKVISKLTSNVKTRFAMLTHDLGKPLCETTPTHSFSKHRSLGVGVVKKFCSRLKVPISFSSLAESIVYCHSYVNLLHKEPTFIDETFRKMNAYRNPFNIAILSQCLYADYYGRLNVTNTNFYAPYIINYIFSKVAKIDVQEVINKGFKGCEIKNEMTKLRLETILKAQQELISIIK
ncbi:MAG: multifunctional CCA addition/repair protein [Succinivibrionaceae bacterium]